MDFMNRSQQPSRPGSASAGNVGSSTTATVAPKRHEQQHPGAGKWFKATSIVLLFSVTILLASLAAFLAFGNTNESKFVDKNNLQAIFVNVNGSSGGQVYFGHIKSLTDRYVRLTNVFYIQNQQNQSNQSQSSSQQTYTLIKLGCELHGPQDEMLINRDQIFFWENLKGNSQVAQKVTDYYKQNPSGQNCTQQNSSNSTQQSSSTSTNNTSNSSSNANNSAAKP